MRTCVGCKVKDETDKFIRYVEFEGKPLPDIARKLPGRGFNICPNFNCIKNFVKKRFKNKVSPEEVYEYTVKALKDYFLHLLSLSHKTGVTVIGQDNIKRLGEREGTLILALDLSEKTKKRLMKSSYLIVDNVFTSLEIGNALRKDRTIGAVFVERAGIGRKLREIGEKLQKLINSRR
ncbi:protein of unknown function DUF448 [Desulfurobacterium thermolithotrophum DSM 11699]|uniref:YlxR domain-containing protein n=1 Tax=Desulfurobacterium thermolithotrophum (strain DSM 11699 / BSA) TaxID=868864 RepID=F0S0H0_DESTD|nr:YlxR family protein [Desulfurobacterium thermolithotrophum]ADY72698.1 protein of unknown function DUF448 [Desulfurobacterium thermolithotrophum DSM 11699]